MTDFKHTHVVLPVIHIEQIGEMYSNAELAHNAGCDGVLLISHGGNYTQLDEYYNLLRAEHPDWWIGVNTLDIHQTVTFEHIKNGTHFQGVNGVWADDAEIYNSNQEQGFAELNRKEKADLDLLYMGGVSFKYVHPPAAQYDEARNKYVHGPNFDAAGAAAVAKDYLDVVVTSGPGTGKAADVGKVEAMGMACTPTPLGIASGLTPENVRDYLPYAKFLLVATGISDTWTTFNPDALQSFVDKVRSWDGV